MALSAPSQNEIEQGKEKKDDVEDKKIQILCKNPYNVNYVIFLQFTSRRALDGLTIKSIKKYISLYCTGKPDPAEIDLIYMGKMCTNTMKLRDLESFNDKYMMHMLFKGKSEYAKSLDGFMEESNIHRATNTKPKPRSSYHESQLRITSDDIAADLDYAEEDYVKYVDRYKELQTVYFQLHGVFFPAKYYQFEDYMREVAERKSSRESKNNTDEVEEEGNAEYPVMDNEDNPAPAAAEAGAVVENNEGNNVEGRRNNRWMDWFKYLFHLLSYALMIGNLVTTIYFDDIPIFYLVGGIILVIVFKNLKHFKFTEISDFSYTDLMLRFVIGIIASISPEWEFRVPTVPQNNANGALENMVNNEE